MKVTLLHNTPLNISDTAISKCWDKSTDNPDERMYRVGIKNKHASTLEHINYSFDIDGISRACLQELARHRMQSLSVKSSRYTLKELNVSSKLSEFFVATGNEEVDSMSFDAVANLQTLIRNGVSNDLAKYAMPECFKTSLVSTMNMRALQNFLSLRTDKSALKEIQELAHAMYNEIPDDHKFMFKDFVRQYDV